MENPERTITNYLLEYGDTREADLIGYLLKKYGGQKRQLHNILNKLEKDKKIFRIVHKELKPPAIYFGLKDRFPLDVQKERVRSQLEKYRIDRLTEAMMTSAELEAYSHGERQ